MFDDQIGGIKQRPVKSGVDEVSAVLQGLNTGQSHGGVGEGMIGKSSLTKSSGRGLPCRSTVDQRRAPA